MEQLLICMSLSLIAGLLASRAAKAIRLPSPLIWWQDFCWVPSFWVGWA